MIAGAAALTAALAALASALLPGKSLGAKSSTGASYPEKTVTAGAPSSTPQLPAPAGAAQLGLQSSGETPEASPSPSQQSVPPPAPQAAPAPVPAPAPSGGGAVVSGGS